MSNEKSFIASLEESILRFLKPKYMDSYEEILDFLNQRSESESSVSVPFFKSQSIGGVEAFSFGNPDSENTILFIHGGAYVNEINLQHLLYCRLLSKKLDAYVVAPVYPLAPNHSCEETFDLISGIYNALIEDKKENISLIGDSAGGGFILSFCQYLKTIGISQPERIVVFSPWVDVSFSNGPYDSQNDPILGEMGLKEIGKRWAGDLDTKNHKVSPIYGNNEGLPRTLIFTGDNEIFYKDIKLFYEKLLDDNVDASLVIGKGLFHIYPMFPVPEARDAFREIKKEFGKLDQCLH